MLLINILNIIKLIRQLIIKGYVKHHLKNGMLKDILIKVIMLKLLIIY